MLSSRTNHNPLLALIKENSRLFWYIPENEKENISLEALVETILNYGDLDAVRQLFNKVGMKTVADIFFRQTNRSRVNYFPQVANFFTIYFNRHAQGSIDTKAV